MSTEKFFLKPKLVGARFDDHTLPVNILEDFSALEELIFELAKKIYIDENNHRKRVPNHFTDNIQLKLSSIEEGSTIPNFVIAVVTTLSSPTLPAQNDAYFHYFEKARDKVFEAVELANEGKSTGLDAKYLNFFNKIGRNLREGETIDLLNNSASSRNVRFDRSTRKRILLSRGEKLGYEDILNDIVLISALDKKNKTFHVELNGEVIKCEIDKNFKDVIYSANEGYDNKCYVAIKAIGVYNDKEELISIDNIESMDILDPFDVSARLKELSRLQNNWYNGDEGVALNTRQLKEFENLFENFYNIDLPLPAIFPTLSGNILLEWKKDNLSVSIEVNLSTFSAEIFYFDMKNDDNDMEYSMNLEDEDSWLKINNMINNIIHDH
ncbi:MAG: hypothetical protein EOO43_05395 [Flavobacterium sp.]|nr:MAG: hypothetical protein EOO43_05395 [Flavobacterium sp.]